MVNRMHFFYVFPFKNRNRITDRYHSFSVLTIERFQFSQNRRQMKKKTKRMPFFSCFPVGFIGQKYVYDIFLANEMNTFKKRRLVKQPSYV